MGRVKCGNSARAETPFACDYPFPGLKDASDKKNRAQEAVGDVTRELPVLLIPMSRRCFSSLGVRRYRQQAQPGNTIKQLPHTISRLLNDESTSFGSEVTVSGWVRSIRKQKAVAFVTVNDGSSVNSMQVVAPRDLVRE